MQFGASRETQHNAALHCHFVADVAYPVANAVGPEALDSVGYDGSLCRPAVR